MIAVFPYPLNNMQLYFRNDFGNLLVFFRQLSLCFIWTASNKSSSIITLTNAGSWFITEYHFNSIVHVPCLFLCFFFCWCLSAGFCWAFFYVNPISFSRFLMVLSQTLTPVLIHCSFFIFSAYWLQFCIQMLWCLLLSTIMFFFFFFNHSISFMIASTFRHSLRATLNAFRHTSLLTVFLNEFYNPFHCFNWQFFCFNHVSFHLLMSERTTFLTVKRLTYLGLSWYLF